jgi:hypothetical protein
VRRLRKLEHDYALLKKPGVARGLKIEAMKEVASIPASRE